MTKQGTRPPICPDGRKIVGPWADRVLFWECIDQIKQIAARPGGRRQLREFRREFAEIRQQRGQP